MKKKVLLLGGAGFIGLNIARYLGENRDYELTIADNFFRHGGKEDDVLSALVSKFNIRVCKGDFTDADDFSDSDSKSFSIAAGGE